MGCPAESRLEATLTFSICTHDPDTGVLTNADTLPIYRVYEDDNNTALLSGDMERRDASNTTGAYMKKITCSAANGFEIGKSYEIYIEATVDGDKGGITFGFKIIPAQGVQKGVALNDFAFEMLSSSDHITPATGLTVTATIQKDGGAFAAAANSVSELSNGVYLIDWTATELIATVVVFKFTAPGADQRTITIILSE